MRHGSVLRKLLMGLREVSGAGKSYLGAALAQAACRHGYAEVARDAHAKDKR